MVTMQHTKNGEGKCFSIKFCHKKVSIGKLNFENFDVDSRRVLRETCFTIFFLNSFSVG